jgi:hypothetical protein
MILPQVLDRLARLARLTPIRRLARAAVASAILCNIAGFGAAQLVDRPVCEALMALEPKNFHFGDASAIGAPRYRVNVGKAGIGSSIALRTGFTDPIGAPVNVPLYIIGANAADQSFQVSRTGDISLEWTREGNFLRSFDLAISGEAHGRSRGFHFDSVIERGMPGDVVAERGPPRQGGYDVSAIAYFVNYKEMSDIPISQLVRHDGDWRTHSTYGLVLRLSDSCSAHPPAPPRGPPGSLSGNPPDRLASLVPRTRPDFVANGEIGSEMISGGETIPAPPIPDQPAIP